MELAEWEAKQMRTTPMLCARRILSALLLAWLTASAHSAFAVTTYQVSLDTTPLLNAQSAGPFSIAFALSDGNGLADGTSTATVSQVNFGGGRGYGSPFTSGGVSGSLESGVTLTTSDFRGLFAEAFSPGARLEFTITLTSTERTTAGFPPDRLAMFILDGTGTPLATLSPGADYFLGINFHPEEARADVFGSDSSRPPFTGIPILLSHPRVDD
jgi:hypothetical protein